MEEISAYGDRILNVHVKDRKYMGSTVPLGSGDAQLQSALEELLLHGYKGRFILQTARCYDGNDSEVLLKYKDLTLKYLSGTLEL